MEPEEMPVARCYAKYVFLDVVQFSKRSAEAQSEIVHHLNEIVLQTLNARAVNSETHRILIPTGDGMCIALISPGLAYDAHIQFALTILQSVEEHNAATQSETRRFQVRIGINQNTDILVSDINGRKNIAGAGINIASRIMDKADGGQVLVSQAVFHELQPSELYMDKFKSFYASGKHNISFHVYQYLGDEHIGLNKETPSAFFTRQSEEMALSEEVAHYFAQAIKHKKDLLRIKAESQLFWDDAAVVLLSLLADDSFRLSKATEFDDPPTTHTAGAGKKTFDEHYAYYRSMDIWVTGFAGSNIVHNGQANDGLDLASYSSCFEISDFTCHYEFINDHGVAKLSQEWPGVWEQFELEQYL